MFVEFSLRLLYSAMWENFSNYGVYTPRKSINSRHNYSCPSPFKTRPQVLVIKHYRQKEITHSPRQHSFENLFPQTTERSGGNYDLLYQNSVRKYEDDLEH